MAKTSRQKRIPKKKRRGRPPLPSEDRMSKELRVRFTDAEHAKILAAGGSEWVRKIVREQLGEVE